MGKSAKKRLAVSKPVSKKTKLKFEKRMEHNNKVISKLQLK
jgi:hypothetical protein